MLLTFERYGASRRYQTRVRYVSRLVNQPQRASVRFRPTEPDASALRLMDLSCSPVCNPIGQKRPRNDCPGASLGLAASNPPLKSKWLFRGWLRFILVDFVRASFLLAS